MKTFKNRLFATAIIAGLAVIGSVMNSRQSTIQGAAGPTVTIDQTQLPLPVQGFLGVSGNVAATQSGAWNVGIAGTPNVNVASLPAVQLSGTPTVNVATPSGAPLMVVNLSDRGRTPYQATTNMPCGNGGCNGSFPAVPSGHRLVVEHLSASFLGTAQSPVVASVFSPSPGGFLLSFVVPLQAGGTAAAFDQPILVYFDAGIQPSAGLSSLTAPMLGGGTISLSGYLVDCTLGPCAPIAQ
jgi:hypothetical protein